MIEQTEKSQPAAPTALVLGATGGIGGAVARGLVKRGWRVQALNRNAEKARAAQPQLSWIQGDAMNPADVLRAAEGATLLVHAVNPPGYRDWDKLVLPMLDNSISAARSVGATILLPGTIYNFGPDAFPILDEDSIQNPVTRKGAIRVEMERRLQAASLQGVSTIIVRAGDFFGPGAANNWFSQGLVTPGKAVKAVTNPGRSGLAHQWAYLPDVAETMIRLVERSHELPPFARFHINGFWDADGQQLIKAICRVTGSRPKMKSFPWWIVPLAAPFVPFFKELREMRYLWQQPIRLDNARLKAFLGAEPCTPIDAAIRATLMDLGCLDAATETALSEVATSS